MDKFTLTIALGNEAMQHPLDVANALRELAAQLDESGTFPGTGRVRDLNGNTVGEWEVDA